MNEGPRDPARQSAFPPDQPEAVRRDIAETRARIDQTLDEIQHRLSPQNLKQQAMAAMKNQSRRAGQRMSESARSNPLPALLAGAGMSWWIASAMRRRGERRRQGQAPTERDAQLREQQALYDAGIESQGTFMATPVQGAESESFESESSQSQARQRASEIGQRAQGKASEWGHRAQERAGQAAQRFSQARQRVGQQMSGRASKAGESIRAGGQSALGSAQDAYEQHPISMCLAVMAAGLAAGLLLPSTRREDEWMGETRDQLMEQARGYGGDLWERGRHVAQAAAEGARSAATEEAQEQGLTEGAQQDQGESASASAREEAQGGQGVVGTEAEGQSGEQTEPEPRRDES